MTHRLLAAGLCLVLGGCSIYHPPPPQQTLSVSNPGYKVDLLFKDPNGVSVYRFFDDGDYRYYTVGPDGAHMLPTTTTVTDVETVDTSTDSGGHGHGGHGGHH